MPRRSGICSAVVILEVAAPLTLARDGDVAIFSHAVALVVGRGGLATTSVRATVGVCDSASDGSGFPREW
jgi:hypothetical protein